MKHVLLVIGIIFLAAAIRMAFISGISNNTIFFAIFTCAFFIYRTYYEKLIKKVWLNFLIGVSFFLYLILIGFIAANGIKGTVTYQEDAALVLGAGITNGEVRQILSMRLDKAVEYHEKNPTALIVVSGGLGRNENITEALAMERYLTEKGVPAHLIHQEGASISTYTNMLYSKPIIDDLFEEEPTVVVITSDFHIYRSVQFAQRVGFNNTSLPAPIPWYAVPVNYVREAAAVVKMWVAGV